LPSLPTTPCNHDGYTKLNFAPATENARQLSGLVYDNFIDFEESSHSSSATHDSDLNSRYVSSTENVNKVDEVENVADAIVTTIEMERCDDEGLDTSGYLKLFHVPSTEDISKLDDKDKDYGVVVRQSGGSRGDVLDRNGCLVLQHAASPKIVRTVDGNNGRVESSAAPSVSLQDDSRNEDSVDRNGFLKSNHHSPSADNIGRTDSPNYCE